jgi:hypothetical protein
MTLLRLLTLILNPGRRHEEKLAKDRDRRRRRTIHRWEGKDRRKLFGYFGRKK